MFKKNAINKFISFLGVEIHGKGFLQSLAKGEFKNDSFQVQHEFIRKKDVVIFDIGANVGDTTARYLEYFPFATIFAFEPFPGSYQHLKNKFANNKKIKCYPNAVASSNGLKKLYVNRNVDTNSLLRPQKAGLTSDEQVRNVTTITVDSIVLDEFCVAENINHIDILKMDIQGGEYDALKGLDNILSRSAIDLIYLEVYFVQQYEGQPLFHDIAKFLFRYGYHLQDIYSPIYGNGSLAWADVIFTRHNR